jgi:hypothetical protein
VDPAFASAFHIEWTKPATEGELVAAEKALAAPLPAEVRAWYRAANGGQAGAGRAELKLHSLDFALGWVERTTLGELGHWPLATNADSNPICVVCKGPLLGYVVQWEHDGEPRVLYRSVAGFFREATEQLAREGYLDTHELKGDFEAPERTPEDVQAGRGLVRTVAEGAVTGMAATSTLMFAADLLTSADEIRTLAELGDEYVWTHVTHRLSQLGTPDAERTVGSMANAYDDFVEKCAEQLRAAGFEVEIDTTYERKGLTVNPHDIGLNMEMFFAQRSEPGVYQYLLERVRALVAIHEKEAEEAKQSE